MKKSDKEEILKTTNKQKTVKMHEFFLKVIILVYILKFDIIVSSLALDDSRLYVHQNSTEIKSDYRVEYLNIAEKECDHMVEIPIGSFKFLSNGNIFIKRDDATYDSSHFQVRNGKLYKCDPENEMAGNSEPNEHDTETEYPNSHNAEISDDDEHNEEAVDPILKCEYFTYQPKDFNILENGTVMIKDEVLKNGTYRIKEDGSLISCVEDYDDLDLGCIPHGKDGEPSEEYMKDDVLIYIGKIGAGISIAALLGHLLIFCLVPTLRNLPGYNLACFSTSLMLAFCFVLIGQIPEVLGTECIISAILQQNFFLAAFFWMNTMAFDVWRSLRLATEKLIVRSNSMKKKRFVYYCLYSWGGPLVITGVSVVFDNVDSLPSDMKPEYGKCDVCFITNMTAKGIFFMFPSFVLFIMNAIFFGLSARILINNTMKVVSDDRQAVKMNLVLYARVAVIMGLTWLISLIATYSNWRPMWYVFDILNSTQGLFVFLLFSCSRKVWLYLRHKSPDGNSKWSSSGKHTNSTGKSETADTAARNSDVIVTTNGDAMTTSL